MRKGKILEGQVISDACDKTITVLVKMKFSHQLYKRPLVKKKKFRVHDAKNQAKVGDRVRIIESRPFSKNKYFELLEITK
ncbi:MAG: 30S ribosomal protein S17 [Candidatus Omnitrophota bacterium]